MNNDKDYYVYVVYEVLEKKPKIWKISGKDFKEDGNVIKTPVLYKMSFETREK
jgi:hypothetical protein